MGKDAHKDVYPRVLDHIEDVIRSSRASSDCSGGGGGGSGGAGGAGGAGDGASTDGVH